MMKSAVFLDRDGTINEEMGYINHPSRFFVFPFVPEAISLLNKINMVVVIITNQSGVARGYFTESLVIQIHNQFKNYLLEHRAYIDAIYYCPHHPVEGKGKYKKDCDCRKPKPGMVLRAVKEQNIDLKRSYLIGDRYKDIEYADKLNLTSGLVMTGYGRGEYEYQRHLWKLKPDIIGENLLEIVKVIYQKERNRAKM